MHRLVRADKDGQPKLPERLEQLIQYQGQEARVAMAKKVYLSVGIPRQVEQFDLDSSRGIWKEERLLILPFAQGFGA